VSFVIIYGEGCDCDRHNGYGMIFLGCNLLSSLLCALQPKKIFFNFFQKAYIGYLHPWFQCDGQVIGEMTYFVSDTGWITFGQHEDQTVPSYQPDEEQQPEQEQEEEEEEEEVSETDVGPERQPAAAAEQQKSRDEIAMEQALAKYSAQLEQRQ